MGEYLFDRIPPFTKEELALGIQKADQVLVSSGITSLNDASANNNTEKWGLFRSWKERKILTPRVNMMLGAGALEDYAKNRFCLRGWRRSAQDLGNQDNPG